MFLNISFKFLPFITFIPNLLAVGTDGHYSLQLLYVVKGVLQFFIYSLQFPFLLQGIFISGKKKVKYLDAVRIDEKFVAGKKNFHAHVQAWILS